MQLSDQPSKTPASIRSELQSCGVSVIDCPHSGRKDVADKMMIVDMMAHAIDNPAPSTIVLITGDRDFVYAVSILSLRNHKVVLIAPRHSHDGLKAQADSVYDWPDDFLTPTLSHSFPLGRVLTRTGTVGSPEGDSEVSSTTFSDELVAGERKKMRAEKRKKARAEEREKDQEDDREVLTEVSQLVDRTLEQGGEMEMAQVVDQEMDREMTDQETTARETTDGETADKEVIQAEDQEDDQDVGQVEHQAEDRDTDQEANQEANHNVEQLEPVRQTPVSVYGKPLSEQPHYVVALLNSIESLKARGAQTSEPSMNVDSAPVSTDAPRPQAHPTPNGAPQNKREMSTVAYMQLLQPSDHGHNNLAVPPTPTEAEEGEIVQPGSATSVLSTLAWSRPPGLEDPAQAWSLPWIPPWAPSSSSVASSAGTSFQSGSNLLRATPSGSSGLQSTPSVSQLAFTDADKDERDEAPWQTSAKKRPKQIPAEFKPLVKVLKRQFYQGTTRVESSQLGTLLSDEKNPPSAVYKQAGVSRLKEYTALAAEMGIVTLGKESANGQGWVALNPVHRKKAA
ncbi:NYN domain-containing protein [Cubamyces menziesii]|nr:NYN domain-containing protein [Cubamyces menziesii]